MPLTSDMIARVARKQRLADAAAEADHAKKLKVLSTDKYMEICNFICKFGGLAIDCEIEMITKRFLDVNPSTLRSILDTEWSHWMRSQQRRYETDGKKFLKQFERKMSQNSDEATLVYMAVTKRISPIALCRIVLHVKYPQASKEELERLLQFPSRIEDKGLSSNVMHCLCCDNQEGPLVQIRQIARREEYIEKLKTLASALRLQYHDGEGQLEVGIRNTPTINLRKPFFYEGNLVFWIDSKSSFGDTKTHKYNIQQQLKNYATIYGPGIVIYWDGYLEEAKNLKENEVGIFLLDDLPELRGISFEPLDMSLEGTSPLNCDDCGMQYVQEAEHSIPFAIPKEKGSGEKRTEGEMAMHINKFDDHTKLNKGKVLQPQAQLPPKPTEATSGERNTEKSHSLTVDHQTESYDVEVKSKAKPNPKSKLNSKPQQNYGSGDKKTEESSKCEFNVPSEKRAHPVPHLQPPAKQVDVGVLDNITEAASGDKNTEKIHCFSVDDHARPYVLEVPKSKPKPNPKPKLNPKPISSLQDNGSEDKKTEESPNCDFNVLSEERVHPVSHLQTPAKQVKVGVLGNITEETFNYQLDDPSKQNFGEVTQAQPPVKSQKNGAGDKRSVDSTFDNHSKQCDHQLAHPNPTVKSAKRISRHNVNKEIRVAQFDDRHSKETFSQLPQIELPAQPTEALTGDRNTEEIHYSACDSLGQPYVLELPNTKPKVPPKPSVKKSENGSGDKNPEQFHAYMAKQYIDNLPEAKPTLEPGEVGAGDENTEGIAKAVLFEYIKQYIEKNEAHPNKPTMPITYVSGDDSTEETSNFIVEDYSHQYVESVPHAQPLGKSSEAGSVEGITEETTNFIVKDPTHPYVENVPLAHPLAKSSEASSGDYINENTANRMVEEHRHQYVVEAAKPAKQPELVSGDNFSEEKEEVHQPKLSVKLTDQLPYVQSFEELYKSVEKDIQPSNKISAPFDMDNGQALLNTAIDTDAFKEIPDSDTAEDADNSERSLHTSDIDDADDTEMADCSMCEDMDDDDEEYSTESEYQTASTSSD